MSVELRERVCDNTFVIYRSGIWFVVVVAKLDQGGQVRAFDGNCCLHARPFRTNLIAAKKGFYALGHKKSDNFGFMKGFLIL